MTNTNKPEFTLRDIARQLEELADVFGPPESKPIEVDGFTPYHTGGGCMALQRPLANGWYMLLTDRDSGALIPTPDDPILLGLYHDDVTQEGLTWSIYEDKPTPLSAIIAQCELFARHCQIANTSGSYARLASKVYRSVIGYCPFEDDPHGTTAESAVQCCLSSVNERIRDGLRSPWGTDYDNQTTFHLLRLVLLDMGLEDSTWGNDECPSISLIDTVKGEHVITVWVDYNDPAMRGTSSDEIEESPSDVYVSFGGFSHSFNSRDPMQLLDVIGHVEQALSVYRGA